MQYSFETKQISTLLTAREKYAENVFCDRNWKFLTHNRESTPSYNADTLTLHFFHTQFLW